MVILWAAVAYLSGALPWSVWLGRLFFRADPRQQPDHNPGAANAFRAAGWRLGAAVLLLDFLKAFVPVAAARWLAGFHDAQLFWIALMPSVGHAFSVFLRFRGGRGITTLFGVWAGLTLYAAPLVMGVAAIGGVLSLKNDEARTMLIPLALIAFLLLTSAPIWMVWLALAQSLALAAKIGAFLYEQRMQRRVGAL